jgi:hypothetical protein
MCGRVYKFTIFIRDITAPLACPRVQVWSFYEIPSTACQLYWSSCKLVKYLLMDTYVAYIHYWVLGPSESEDGGVSVTNVRVFEYPLITGKPH